MAANTERRRPTPDSLAANLMEISSQAVGAVDLCFALFSLSTALKKCEKPQTAHLPEETNPAHST